MSTVVDVFISYKREERSMAKALATAIAARGHSVWWDVELLPGEKFADEIEAVICQAKAAVVLWSRLSIESHWVKEEAREAHKRGILVPVLLDRVEPPFGMRDLQAHDLSNWEGDSNATELDKVLDSISNLVGPIAQTSNVVSTTSISLHAFKVEAEFWRSVSTAEPQSVSEYNEYLERFGVEAHFADLAKARIEKLRSSRPKKRLSRIWKSAVGILGVAGTVVAILGGVQKLSPRGPELSDNRASLGGAESPIELPPQSSTGADQENSFPGGNGGMEITENSTVAQSFSINRDGILFGIDVVDVRHHRCMPSESLYISLIKMNGDLLGDSTLRTWEIHADKVDGEAIEFRNINHHVTKDQQYAILLQSDAPGSGCTYAWGGGMNKYSNGTSFINGQSNQRDMKFRSYVR